MYLLRVILLQVFDHCSILSSIPWKRKLWAARNLEWHQIVDLFFFVVVVVHYRISKYLARNLIFFCFCHETDFQNVTRCACLTTQVWGAGNVMFDLDLCSQGSVCFWSRMLLWRYLLRCYTATLLNPSGLPKKNKSMNKTDKKIIIKKKTPPGHIRFFPSVYTHQ